MTTVRDQGPLCHLSQATAGDSLSQLGFSVTLVISNQDKGPAVWEPGRWEHWHEHRQATFSQGTQGLSKTITQGQEVLS